MAEYRTVRMGFWNDPYIESLSPEHKLLYLYLFTCPHTNNLGILEVSANRISFESGLPAAAVSSGLGRFEADGKLLRDGLKLWLTRFIKHQTTTSEKLVLGLRRLIPEIGSQTICAAVCERYPHLFDTPSDAQIPSDTVSIPSEELEVGSLNLEGEGEEESKGTPLPPTGDRHKIPPMLEWVVAYCEERKNGIDPQEFCDHYASANWFRGKTKIKDWQGCMRTWEAQRKREGPRGRDGNQQSFAQQQADLRGRMAKEVQEAQNGVGKRGPLGVDETVRGLSAGDEIGGRTAAGLGALVRGLGIG